MVSMQFKSFAALAFLCAPINAAPAIVSLFVPDITAPAALSASEVGTDSSGHTTWVIGPGQASGSLAAPTGSFAITLVAGPSDVQRLQSVAFSDPPGVTGVSHPPTFFHDDCVLDGSGAAVCTRVLSVSGGPVSTAAVVTQQASAIALQVAEPSGTGSSGANALRARGVAGLGVVIGVVAGAVGVTLF